MPRQAITWIVTDMHLYHDKVITLSGRPKNYMSLLFQNLNKYVQPQDTLVDLGDVIFYKHEELKPFLDAIPCKTKILCMGNHDKKSRGWYERNGYDLACDRIQIGDVLLSHIPVRSRPDGVRVNVHGHLHTNRQQVAHWPWWSDKTHRLLSMEEAGYKPVKLIDVAR